MYETFHLHPHRYLQMFHNMAIRGHLPIFLLQPHQHSWIVFDFDEHCQFEFGDCAQANEHTDPRNNMRTRCIDGMCLRPADNGTGHYLMDLQTGREVIRGKKITVIPLTDTVKNVVEDMGIRQGFKELKFQKKSGETLPHEDLVPGQDYNALNKCNDIEGEEKKMMQMERIFLVVTET